MLTAKQNEVYNKIVLWFWYLFLCILPFGARHIFNFSAIQSIEGFREHLTWSVFGFDIVLIVILFFVIIHFHKEIATWLHHHIIPFFGALLLIPITVYWTQHSINPSILYYQIYRFLLAAGLYLIGRHLLKNRQVLQQSLLILLIGGILQSLLAIIQFALNHSIGLTIMGESLLRPDMLGVAKLELLGLKHIRSYGLFPHPNVLGAFLLLACTAGILRIKKVTSSENKTFTMIGLLLIGTGIGLTFSRSVWLMAIMLIGIFAYRPFIQLLKRSRIAWLTIIIIGIVIVVFLVNTPHIQSRLCLTHCVNDQSFSLRMTYHSVALYHVIHHPFLGIGPGNFVPSYPMIQSIVTLKPWEQQPVHNLFLLIASETGLLGVFLFVILLISLHQQQAHALSWNHPLRLLLYAFLMIGLIDHYFWTLAQGQLLFAMTLAIFASSSRIDI